LKVKVYTRFWFDPPLPIANNVGAGGIRKMLKTKILTNVFVVVTFVVTFLAFYLAAASNIA
jgi:hypothetical protein